MTPDTRARVTNARNIRWTATFPRHWQIVPSKRLFREQKERALPGDEQLTASQDYGVILQSDFIERAGRRVVQITQHMEMRKHVEKDDFVISMRSFQGGLERAWVSGCIRSSYVVLRPSPEVHPGFYAHFFKSHAYIAALQATALFIRDGQDLNIQNFNLVDLPKVPLGEQRAIADFLDKKTAAIDALIAKKERLIELLQEKRQALITQAVTKGLNPNVPMKDSGVEWIGAVPSHWEVRRLKHIAARLQGRLIVQPHLYFADEGIPIVFGYNIKEGSIDEANVSRVDFETDRKHAHAKARAGDLLTVRLGDPGVTAVVPPSLDGCHYASIMWIHQHPRFHSQWLCHCMNSAVVQRQIDAVNYGAAQTQFNIRDAVNFKLPMPPLAEQSAIASYLDKHLADLVRARQAIRRQLDVLREYRQALITAAVTGKLDVTARSTSDATLSELEAVG